MGLNVQHTYTISYELHQLLKGFSLKNWGLGALFCKLFICDSDDRNTMFIT